MTLAVLDRADSGATLSTILRSGVSLCFIGHGAFGFITKQAWVPYFAVVGISEPVAWKLMPWIGAMDITIGLLAFAWPCRALFAWAAIWALWTALLRPLANQGWSEFLERAGNYGIPIAALVALGLGGAWFNRLSGTWPALADETRSRLIWTLRGVTATLLAGHAGCALLLQKAALAHHYTVLGVADPMRTMLGIGGFEAGLALAALIVRAPAFFIFLGIWKLATECLFLTSGVTAPIFEVIERGGSYIAPLALAWLLRREQPSAPRIAPAV